MGAVHLCSTNVLVITTQVSERKADRLYAGILNFCNLQPSGHTRYLGY